MDKGQLTTHECTSKAQESAVRFSKKTDYGLFLLAALNTAESECHRPIREIAEENDLSFAFLQKVAHLLKTAGLIKALRGKQGGYCLARHRKDITVKEVIEALDGPTAIMHCTDTRREIKCPRESFCSIRAGVAKMNDELNSILLNKTVQQLMS